MPYTLHNKVYKGCSEFLFVLNINGFYSFDFCIEVLDESSCVSKYFLSKMQELQYSLIVKAHFTLFHCFH